jgi:hypothetical protein
VGNGGSGWERMKRMGNGGSGWERMKRMGSGEQRMGTDEADELFLLDLDFANPLFTYPFHLFAHPLPCFLPLGSG